MPYILVATDFSQTGNSAVHYACSLAQALQYEVTVLHTYMVPVAFSDTPMPLIPVEDAEQLAREGMDGLMGELTAQYNGLPVGDRIVYGDVLDCLQEEARKKAPALAILGNSGEEADLWLGSTALEVLRQLDCPVLAVPPSSKFSGLGNICLACDFINIAETAALQPLMALLRDSKARLHLLHIDGEGSRQPWDDTALRSLFTGIDTEMHQSATTGSIDEAVTKFAESQHMDWLAVIPHHHSFWEGLFHKSHTKAMVRMSHIPVLALHGRREEWREQGE